MEQVEKGRDERGKVVDARALVLEDGAVERGELRQALHAVMSQLAVVTNHDLNLKTRFIKILFYRDFHFCILPSQTAPPTLAAKRGRARTQAV